MEEGIRFCLNSPRSTQNGAAKHSTGGHVPRALGSCSPRRWGAAGIKGSHWFLQTDCRKCKNNSRDNFRFYRVCPGSFRAAGFPPSWNNKEVMDGGQSGIPRRGWRQGREGLGGLVSQSAVRGRLHAEAVLLQTSPGEATSGVGQSRPCLYSRVVPVHRANAKCAHVPDPPISTTAGSARTRQAGFARTICLDKAVTHRQPCEVKARKPCLN